MTLITYRHDGNNLSLVCQGHAGYAEHGRDIVCAGISALCGALEIALDNLQDSGAVQSHFCSWSDACFTAEATAAPADKGVSTAFEVIYGGLCRMEEEYGDYMDCRKSKEQRG